MRQLITAQKMSKQQRSTWSGAQKLFYTAAFKQKIMNEVLSGKLNKRPSTMIYGITGDTNILCRITKSQDFKSYEKKSYN